MLSGLFKDVDGKDINAFIEEMAAELNKAEEPAGETSEEAAEADENA